MSVDSGDPLLIELPDQLTGERVIIRPWAEADAAALWDATDQSREHLGPWMRWIDGNRTPDDSVRYIRRARARWLLREDLAVAIIEQVTGRIVGGCGLHGIDWTRRLFETGYWLHPDAVGHGYASEAVQLLVRLAFDELDASRVQVRIDPNNLPSLRLAERLGFVLEGTLRRTLPLPSGALGDMCVLALLPEEYRLLPWAAAARP